jgi:peptidoglycan/LPS O-acetylase OafA/YrhL
MKYRVEIDGLRALAVMPVIFFHAGFEFFNGGFVGVDVFFVISGYLITTILINDIEHNRFSLVNFYERRARRILPALFFVMWTCIPVAWLLMSPSQMKDFSQSFVSVIMFFSNFYFTLEGGYFGPVLENMPLLHTWSLSVEEQFYLLFPLFLVFAWPLGKKKVLLVIVTLAIASLALGQFAAISTEGRTNFFFTPSRAWELLSGSIAAFIVQKRGVQSQNLLSLIGLGLIVFSIFAYDKSIPFPSVYALIPVIGVVLLLLFAGKDTLVARFLSIKLFVGIGLISYSAYLWHQPLFAFVRIGSLNDPSLILMSLLVVLSIVLGWLSWKYVEAPFRNKKNYNRQKIFALSAISCTLLISFGLVGHFTSGYESRYSTNVLSILNSTVRTNSSRCHIESGTLTHPVADCTNFFVDNSASVMLIGDSHLDAIGIQIQQRFKELGVGSYSVSYRSCVALKGFYQIGQNLQHECHKYNQSMLQYARDLGIETLILISRFPLYLDGARYDNGEGGVESGGPVAIDLIERFPARSDWEDLARRERVHRRYTSELKELLNEFNVIVFEPTPEVGWDVVSRFVKLHNIGAVDKIITHSYDSHIARSSDFLSILNELPQKNLYRFSVADVLCIKESGRCMGNDNKGLFYRDDDHLSDYGAKIVADEFIRNLPSFVHK